MPDQRSGGGGRKTFCKTTPCKVGSRVEKVATCAAIIDNMVVRSISCGTPSPTEEHGHFLSKQRRYCDIRIYSSRRSRRSVVDFTPASPEFAANLPSTRPLGAIPVN